MCGLSIPITMWLPIYMDGVGVVDTVWYIPTCSYLQHRFFLWLFEFTVEKNFFAVGEISAMHIALDVTMTVSVVSTSMA